METEAILEELERLGASEQLSRSKRLLRFLHFTVDRTLNGTGESLSEYTIGREVYDRSESFEPLTDGIVRVEAHRLRSKLREYYRSAGRQDPIVIEYPVGSYIPIFRRWAPEFLPKTGQMADVIRAFDWGSSPLGPLASWPRELKSALSLCLQMKFASAVLWRPDFIMLYNDAMHALIDKEGSYSIGTKLSDFDLEASGAIQLAVRSVCETGQPILRDKAYYLTSASGSPRESYFTTSYSPVMDSNGNPAGTLIVSVEVTDEILQQRRSQTVTDLANAPQTTGDDDACREAARILEKNPYDLPFACIYLLDAAKANAEFRAGAGIEPGTGASPEKIPVNSGNHPLASAVITARPEVLEVGRQFGPLPAGAGKIPPHELVVVPLRATRERDVIGMIVAGVNSYRPVDAEYRAFLETVAKQVSNLILRARSQGGERKLAAEMAQQKQTWAYFLDFAAEEFRTPLTVTLGLLEKMLAEQGVKGSNYPALTVARRSSLRLWNAVETLIDLIRVQTDRLEPVFEPVNLSASTEELVRAFASELARPNIRFSLECPPLGEDVFVDRKLWDRLILRLLVSAVHRIDAGEIGISIRKIGPWIDTAIWDTGPSIPDNEKPHNFESFRATGSNSNGADLALARHFAARHGGHVTVDSENGKGSKFIVSVPRGRSHLGAERIAETPEDVRASVHALHSYVENAARWSPEREFNDGNAAGASSREGPAWQKRELVHSPRRRILVAVSDRDLRHYLAKVVSELYTVETAGDGQEALQALQQRSPDLMLLDAELLGIDDGGVLRTARSNTAHGSLPIVLISSRSSEQERLAAFAAGASDYLVKPFSAPELLIRLEAQMALAVRHRRNLLDGQQSLLKDTAQLELLRSVLDQLPIGVMIADRASGEIVIKNRRIREYLGNGADLINRLDDIPEVFGTRPDGSPLHRTDCALYRAVEHGEIVIDETMIYELEDGRRLSVAISGSPIRSTAGAHIGAVVLYRPLSELALAQTR